MGKMVSWSLSNHESSNCPFCGMPNQNAQKRGQISKDHCCKDDQKQICSAGDQKIIQYEFQFLKFGANGVSEKDVCFFSSRDLLISGKFPATDPPPFPKRSAFLLHCNFRI
jgi:hypothetical protein